MPPLDTQQTDRQYKITVEDPGDEEKDIQNTPVNDVLMAATAGALRKSAFLMVTLPRLVGFRLQTLAVKAGKSCSGSPKASSDSGCT